MKRQARHFSLAAPTARVWVVFNIALATIMGAAIYLTSRGAGAALAASAAAADEALACNAGVG
jgi:hypothetical protein